MAGCRSVGGQLRVPSGFRAAAGTTAELYTNSGWAKEIVPQATGLAMVYVPAGTWARRQRRWATL